MALSPLGIMEPQPAPDIRCPWSVGMKRLLAQLASAIATGNTCDIFIGLPNVKSAGCGQQLKDRSSDGCAADGKDASFFRDLWTNIVSVVGMTKNNHQCYMIVQSRRGNIVCNHILTRNRNISVMIPV